MIRTVALNYPYSSFEKNQESIINDIETIEATVQVLVDNAIQCFNNKIPMTVSKSTLSKLCKHMHNDAKKCNETQFLEIWREQALSCHLISIDSTLESFSVRFKLTVQQFHLSQEYESYYVRPFFFYGNGKISSLVLPSGTFYTGHDLNCFIDERLDSFIENADSIMTLCVNALYKQNNMDIQKFCLIRESNLQCAGSYLPNGLVLSTIENVEIVKTSSGRIRSRSTVSKETKFFPNDKEVVTSFHCNGNLYETSKTATFSSPVDLQRVTVNYEEKIVHFKQSDYEKIRDMPSIQNFTSLTKNLTSRKRSQDYFVYSLIGFSIALGLGLLIHYVRAFTSTKNYIDAQLSSFAARQL